MNKQEYLERLEACLKHKLSRDEIEDIMRDYAEYFEEGRRQSKQVLRFLQNWEIRNWWLSS